jgi:hypothetical protein
MERGFLFWCFFCPLRLAWMDLTLYKPRCSDVDRDKCSPMYTTHSCLVTRVRQSLLQAANSSRDIWSLGVRNAHAHVAETNVLCRNLLV